MTAEEIPAASELGRVHFIGVGGVGMSGIARILLARGMTVSGSDAKDSVTLAELRMRGATIWAGHDAANVGEVDTVVVSSAVRESNPELSEARRRGLRVMRRGAALASLMADRTGVAIAGTHGKTTTTSMLTVAAQAARVDPSFAIGADLNEPGSNAHHGSGSLFIAEADESDESFLLLTPSVAIVTNVEADHLDHYGDLAAVDAAFVRFADGLPADGVLVACADDEGSLRLALGQREKGRKVFLYGESPAADMRIGDLVLDGSGSRFDAVVDGESLGAVVLTVPGRHNALNAGGALAAALTLGLPFADVASGLCGFGGARRRFELKGVVRGVRVFDDYAHHPTEVRAALSAAREVAGGGRVIVAFQPHLYSRTAAFAAEFGAALSLADDVVVMDVYAAREDPIPGVTGQLVAAAVQLPAERVVFEPRWSDTPGVLAHRARSGDVVLTIGAGDVTMIGPEVLELLGNQPV
ncbi:MAG: UDP-N-acetylmuramate--alanine ligase [Frankiaceae bacterium]|nr:UDP-N-acetylmuramate--alanine ligase [Frankiaceae bacterium]